MSENDLQHVPLDLEKILQAGAVARSDVSASTWYADGCMFDDRVRQHSFVEIGHEILPAAVLSLLQIQLLTKGTG